MKRLLLALLIAFAPIAANAEGDFFFKPTAGIDYQYTHAFYESGGNQLAENNIHGANVHVGARIHKNLGIEAGYLWTQTASKDNVVGTTIDTDVRLSGFTLDALGYLPVADKLELIGTIGVSSLHGKFQFRGAGGSVSFTDSETKGRIGAGAQYWLTDKINARMLVRYQGADFSDTVKYAVVATAGLNWQF